MRVLFHFLSDTQAPIQEFVMHMLEFPYLKSLVTATGPHSGSSSKCVRELDDLLEVVNKLYAQWELLKRLRVPILIFALNYYVESRATEDKLKLFTLM